MVPGVFPLVEFWATSQTSTAGRGDDAGVSQQSAVSGDGERLRRRNDGGTQINREGEQSPG